MKRVNDIFYSLQGEGHNTGCPAVFVRFAGCNLRCDFCDTDFSAYREMTDGEIVDEIRNQITEVTPQEGMLVVLTGGEPTLQVDEAFIDLLHENGYVVAMESNGTKEPPKNLDWLTVSPKKRVIVRRCDEVKCIFDGRGLVDDYGIEADYYYLQPCDVGHELTNRLITERCVEYIKCHPRWRLSLQTHKLIGFK